VPVQKKDELTKLSKPNGEVVGPKTMKSTVAHNALGFQQSQFDASIRAAETAPFPEPSAALLFSFGLFGFAAYTYWRRQENDSK
jgi:hypothetical protein